MEQDLERILQENSLAHIATTNLIGICLLAVGTAWVLAWILKNQYNAKYLIGCYLAYLIIHSIFGFLLFKLPVILVVGSYLLGAVFLLVRSNRYFYN